MPMNGARASARDNGQLFDSLDLNIEPPRALQSWRQMVPLIASIIREGCLRLAAAAAAGSMQRSAPPCGD